MGNWGVVDVRDCAACAEWLAKGAAASQETQPPKGLSRRDRAASTEGKQQLAYLSEHTQDSGAKEIILRNPHAGWKFTVLDGAALVIASSLSAVPLLAKVRLA